MPGESRTIFSLRSKAVRAHGHGRIGRGPGAAGVSRPRLGLERVGAGARRGCEAQLRSAAPALVELEVRLGLGLGGVEGGGLVELEGVLGVESEVGLGRWSRGSAIRRAGYAGLKRNVTVALGNWLASLDQQPAEAMSVLRDTLQDEEPLVREHARWALGCATAP